MSEVGIYTAQNVHIDFKLAGLGDRVAAFFIDMLIILAYTFLLSILAPSLPFFNGWGQIIFYLPVLLYHLLFEVLMNGQSPGKKQMNIKVIMQDGSAPGLGAYLLRWILSPIDFFMSGGIAMLSIILTSKSQRLGDMAAGTVVAKEKKLDDYNKSFLRRKADDEYEPVFANVKFRVTQREIDLIRESLKVKVENVNNAPAEKMRKRIEEKLEVSSELATVAFLHTVIKDFDYFNSQPD